MTPIIIYSSDTFAPTRQQLEQLNVVQRKKLRKIAGWISDKDDSWEDMGRKMKRRLESALSLNFVATWLEIVTER